MWRTLIAGVAVAIIALSATVSANEPEPLTLSAVSTRETCTLGSVTTLDYDIQGGQPPYELSVDGRRIEQSSEPHYVPCRASAGWTRPGPPGNEDIQRMIVSVTDAAGNRAYAASEHRLAPGLPAPVRLQVSNRGYGPSTAYLWARWWTTGISEGQRSDDIALRWRLRGSTEWTLEHLRRLQTYDDSHGASWTTALTHRGQWLELQAAQLRHLFDLRTPLVLNWSPTTSVTILDHPWELQAEATHDTITLTWGPHTSGQRYIAELYAVQPGYPYRSELELGVRGEPIVEARFEDLLPDTLYHVRVYLDQGHQWGYALEHNRFELRTEPAPEGWSSLVLAPTDIQATIEDRQLEVNWTPPPVGSRFETRVCARPLELEWRQSCENVSAGQTRALLQMPWHHPGGTFEIRVSTLAAPPRTSLVEIHVPTYEPNLPTGGDPPAAPAFVDLHWVDTSGGHYGIYAGIWRFDLESNDAELAELSWQARGRTFIRESRDSDFSIQLDAGAAPQSLRVRLLQDGVWTPWSVPARIPTVVTPPGNVRIGERMGALQIHWDPPEHSGVALEYRLHVRRNYEEAEAIDVGQVTSATIPIRPDDENYWVAVDAIAVSYGEVSGGAYGWYARSPLELRVTAEFSPCPPAQQAPIMVLWDVRGGAPPFTVSLGDQLGFQTEERSGHSVVTCRTNDSGSAADMHVSVMDANGDTQVGWFSPSTMWDDAFELEEDPFGVSLTARSVHRHLVLLSWSCRYWPFTTALRWRELGATDWNYVTELRQTRDGDYRCRGTWDGLKPITSYEYQVARFEPSSQLRSLERLGWTKTHTVTTLGPPQQLSIERKQQTVTATWERQLEAWAYVVGLRSNGRSWWKRYNPSGEPMESVHFSRIPEEIGPSVQLISPPLKDGRDTRPWGFDTGIPSGH